MSIPGVTDEQLKKVLAENLTPSDCDQNSGSVIRAGKDVEGN